MNVSQYAPHRYFSTSFLQGLLEHRLQYTGAPTDTRNHHKLAIRILVLMRALTEIEH